MDGRADEASRGGSGFRRLANISSPSRYYVGCTSHKIFHRGV
jgi:hypothetical protein